MAAAYKSLLWLAWLLEFCGWAILLAGVAAMQQNCGSSNIDVYGQALDATSPANAPNVNLNSLGVGLSGYFGPVRCKRLFSYVWWTTWYEFLILILLPVLLAMGRVHTFRAGLIGLIAPVTVLLMDTANTMIYVENITSGTFASRANATLAGAIICSIANFLKIILLGIHNEKAAFQKTIGAPKEPAPTTATTLGGVYVPPGTVPVSTTTGTTTSVAPVRAGAPLATDVASQTYVSTV